MNKLKIFWYTLRRTFTSLDYYQEILQAPLSFSLKFFWAYWFFYSLVATAVIGVVVLWPFQSFFTKVVPYEAAQLYPDELIVTIQDGAASVNVAEPFYLPLSNLDRLRDEFDERIQGASTQMVNNLLVIDTQAKIEDFPQYQTMALLTKHHLSVRDDDGNLRSIPLAEAPNIKVTKADVQRMIEMALPYLPYIVPIMIGSVFLGLLLFMPSWKLFYNFWLAAVLWLLGKVMRFPITYRKAYQVGLHFLVISTTFFSLWYLVGWPIEFPWLQTMSLAFLGVIVFRHLQGMTSSSPNETS